MTDPADELMNMDRAEGLYDDDRRERYAAAIREAVGPVGILLVDARGLADAAMAVADEELAERDSEWMEIA